MKRILQIISLIALAGTIIPSLVYLTGGMELDQMKMWMWIATVVWFVTVPMWMGREGTTGAQAKSTDQPG